MNVMIPFFSSELWKVIISGGIGGISLWGAVYPADVIKSKTQVMIC